MDDLKKYYKIFISRNPDKLEYHPCLCLKVNTYWHECYQHWVIRKSGSAFLVECKLMFLSHFYKFDYWGYDAYYLEARNYLDRYMLEISNR